MSILEGFNSVDFSNVDIENERLMEFEVGDYVSILYNKKENTFFIYGIDFDDSFDEFVVEIDDTFDGLEVNGTKITRQDYLDFKQLIENEN